MSRIDQKLVFHDEQAVNVSGHNYGAKEVALPKDQDLSGFTSVEILVKGSFGTSGTVEINLVGGTTTGPTAIIQPIYKGSAADLVSGKTIRVGITPGALKEFNRIDVLNSGAMSAGAKILSYLV